MINRINFLGQIQTIQGKKNEHFQTKPMECDCFVKSANLKESAIKKAKEIISEELAEKNLETGVIISPDGEICQISTGNEHSCSFDTRKIAPNALLIHGHPVELPLSSGDIAVLLATPASTQEAIMKDGKFSRISKKTQDNGVGEYRQLYYELEKQLNLMALDKLGIDYKTNYDDVAAMGKDYIEYATGQSQEDLSQEEIFEKLEKYGVDTNKTPKDIAEKLKELMFYQLLLNPHKYDKEHNCILDNIDTIKEFLETEEGLQIRHNLVQKAAQDYDLIYETNLF
mgnify:FL=1